MLYDFFASFIINVFNFFSLNPNLINKDRVIFFSCSCCIYYNSLSILTLLSSYFNVSKVFHFSFLIFSYSSIVSFLSSSFFLVVLSFPCYPWYLHADFFYSCSFSIASFLLLEFRASSFFYACI